MRTEQQNNPMTTKTSFYNSWISSTAAYYTLYFYKQRFF